jgi:hypothetical protein
MRSRSRLWANPPSIMRTFETVGVRIQVVQCRGGRLDGRLRLAGAHEQVMVFYGTLP